MTLQQRTSAIVGVSVLALITVVYAIASTVMMDGFREVERRTVIRHVERAAGAIDARAEDLAVRVGHWAASDEACRFIAERNPEYIRSHLQVAALSALSVRAALFYDTQGRLLYGTALDPHGARLTEVPAPLLAAVARNASFRMHPSPTSRRHGVIALGEGPFLIASRPIVASDRSGPVRGTLVFAQSLDVPTIARLAERLRLEIDLAPIFASELPPEQFGALLASPDRLLMRPRDEQTIDAYTLINDIHDRAALQLRVGAPRFVYVQGVRTMRSFMVLLIGTAALFLLITMRALRVLVLSRLSQLSSDVAVIAAGNDFAQRVRAAGSDELGHLAGIINQLLETVRSSQLAIVESENRTRRIIDTALDAVVTMDDRGIITGWNPQAEVLLGWSRSEAIGRRFTETLVTARPGDEADPARYLDPQGARSVLNRRLETVVRRRDGSEFTVEFAVTRLETEGRVSYSAFLRDITEARRTSAELKKFTDDIVEAKNRLEEQTRELAAKSHELEQARALAEAASRAKSDFLANMSHEIRTPMTAILGYADLMLDPAQSADDRAACVQTVRRNGEHLLLLINDILDLSKIEAGMMRVEAIAVDPVQIVEEVASLMRVRALAKGLELRVAARYPLPASMHSDPIRIRQIVVNLVSNAIKFTHAGSVTVELSMAGERNERLRIAVRDTGIGLTSEQTAGLFQPFSQADESTTRRYGGTGLGLTISRRLARLLDGEISVESEAGCGSTFTVEISSGPAEHLVLCDRLGARPDGVHPTQQAPPPDALAGTRILLAEDGRDNQRLFAFHLRKAGAQVTIVDNGRLAAERALEAAARQTPFTVVLMDMQMPELDGYGATALLRSKGYTGPIIALTAHSMPGDREKCIGAGCDDYFTKPLDHDRLIGLCAKYRHGTRAGQPSRTVSN